ncbi:MAG: AAA family ATPase [Bacillus subtilis]|nr:AAA family ATPase [Bacillus subtilis]
MFERKITRQLNEWHHQNTRQALIIEGARQVGKTFIIQKFADLNYHHRWIEINFILSPKWKDLSLAILLGKPSTPNLVYCIATSLKSNGRILLFLDEIQACPEAITALKSFTIDGRLDVIASGSLLGVH